MNKPSEIFDLRDEYIRKQSKLLAIAMDWEALGMFHPIPEDYHFTKNGSPDKRYSNYPEVQAYVTAELEERARIMDKAYNEH